MYLDISACANLPEPVMATFRENGPGRGLRALRLWRDGVWTWCAITGWDAAGAVPAVIQPIEESGDGVALLVHGGPCGLRLAATGDPEASVRWDLADSRQWGEPFLIVRPDTEWR